ncbi:unnamed protein product [Mytilus coruscus]|uniref:Uncharacterized protein n=1 Tax=Mytilus coruscus TaxID=42192 RepID=A0A6J8AVA3_MYTCO|nr:unnamed protein product [Mytilus coruscus]
MEGDLDIVIIEHSNLTQVDFQDGIHLSRESGVPVYDRNIKEKLNTILCINYLHETQPKQVQGNKYQRHWNHNHRRKKDREFYDSNKRVTNIKDIGTIIIDVKKTGNFMTQTETTIEEGIEKTTKGTIKMFDMKTWNIIDQGMTLKTVLHITKEEII